MPHALLRMRGALRPIVAAALLLTLSALTAHAATGFTLLPQSYVSPGQLATLSGTITNSGPDTVYYNGLSYQFLSAPGGAITDPNDPNVAVSLYFDNSAPFSLVGTSDPNNPTMFQGNLLDLYTDANAPRGNYTLSISLLGGPEGLSSSMPSNNVLATYNLQTNIGTAPVPELGTGLTFGLILLAMSGVFCATRRKAASAS